MLAAAWSGAALFAAALSWFVYFYFVELAAPAGVADSAAGASTAINTGLFTLFALHHSLLARSGLKARLAARLPRGAERTVYVWIASLLFLAVCVGWQPLPGTAWDAPSLWRWPLYLMQLAGIVVTLRSAARLDIWELAGLKQVRAARETPNPHAAANPTPPGSADLEIGGPYRWVRHPIYFGWVLIVFGAPTMTMSRLLFATISTIYLLIAIPFEERSLVAEFGPSYTAYQRQVRWRIVPGVW